MLGEEGEHPWYHKSLCDGRWMCSVLQVAVTLLPVTCYAHGLTQYSITDELRVESTESINHSLRTYILSSTT